MYLIKLNLVIRNVKSHPCCAIKCNFSSLSHSNKQKTQRPNIPSVPTISQQIHRQFSYQTTITNIWTTVSQSAPVAWHQQNLIQFHDFTGLPWWATIILSTILLRTAITLPLTIYQKVILARLELIGLELPAIQKQLHSETAAGMKQFNWTKREAATVYNRSLKKQWDKLVIRDNCHPLKTLIVIWGQLPLWIIQSVSLRNLLSMLPDPTVLEAQIAYTELTVGGFGWIPNLTQIDSSLILPVSLGLINLLILELQLMARGNKPQTKLQKFGVYFFRTLSVVMVPIAATVPAGLPLYWTTSSAFGLAQNLLLMSPKMKRIVRIPVTPSELDKPYKQLAEAISDRISNLQTIVSIGSTKKV